jgi:hypothetical protein
VRKIAVCAVIENPYAGQYVEDLSEPIDVPLAHKDALYVRSHYDAVTVKLADSPGPDELVVIGSYANRGRINARLGGVPSDRIEGQDGLR